MSQGSDFASIPRHELVATALQLGIERPDSLTAEELTAAIQSHSEGQRAENKASWFAVARHLVASVVEQGLNLPAAAKVIRSVGGRAGGPPARSRPPLPTVTLAQIYLEQRHRDRARVTLKQVLERQPDNTKARSLLEQLDREEALSQSEQAPHGSAQSKSVAVPPSAVPPSAVPPSAVPPSEAEAPVVGAGAAASGEKAPSEGAALEVPKSKVGVSDLVVQWDEGDLFRIAWQLGSSSQQLIEDEGVELQLRTIVPAFPIPDVTELRVSLEAPSGERRLPRLRDAELRAALIDAHGSILVLARRCEVNAAGDAEEVNDAFAPVSDGRAADLVRALR